MERQERKDELLLLAAISGEIPSDWIACVVGSESYAAALLTRLKKEGYLKLRSKDGIRGYILRQRGKSYLLEKYRTDVEAYLTGAVSTNHVKSEPEKRLRLHRMSMVWIFFFHARIPIFSSEKPELFPAFHPTSPRERRDCGQRTAYYGTAEWKQETDKEINGSRACGILAADRFYIVYNSMDHLMKWVPKTERNLKSRMDQRFRRIGGAVIGGAVFMGKEMNLLNRLLTSDGGIKGELYRMDDIYERIFYIPFIREAQIQLRLLMNQHEAQRLRRFLDEALWKLHDESTDLSEGITREGTPVYFCYDLELWKLKRIKEKLVRDGNGILFCFYYQKDALNAYFGKRVILKGIVVEKVVNYLNNE